MTDDDREDQIGGALAPWTKGIDKEELDYRRETMGTSAHRDAEPTTQFFRGAEATEVELISGPENPYRDMFIHAGQTWGAPYDSKAREWEQALPIARMERVYHTLTRQNLPLALELPDFYFEVRGASRIAFDQIARMRIGVTFSSEGTRDNDVADIPVMVPPRIWDRPELRSDFEITTRTVKETYRDMVQNGIPWADARHVIPQGIVHRFAIDINYAALSTFLGKRLRFCMDFATVAVAWKMLEEVRKKYAVLAVPLRPDCDYARQCTYRAEGRPGEAYSNLFRGCGRWPDPNPVAEWDCSSTDQSDIVRWVPSERDLILDGTLTPDWKEAFRKDWRYFAK